MATHQAISLYQETRLDPEPNSQASVVEFSLPAHSANAHSYRPSPKRRRIEASTADQDEDSFARQHLAAESSVHFRPHGDPSKPRPSPHSILWRVLDERKVLELQAVDIHNDVGDKEQHSLTLRFEFYAAIRPKGITFAETSEGLQGPLVVFIITRLGELYELKIPRNAFSRANALDVQSGESAKWFSSDVPNAISYHPPHSFVAKSDRELWVSLSDGGLVRLERQESAEGEITWHESWFTEGSWVKGFSNLIPWKSAATARFDGVDLNLKTALAISAAPDGRHIWTAGLDHTLKAWDVETGKIACNMDLAGNLARDMEKLPERLLDPSQSNILNVFAPKSGGDDYIVAVYSPWTRQFKFWHVMDAASTDHGILDMNPDFEFTPPIEDLLDTNIWTLEAFHVKPFRDGRKKDWTLWLLVRSGSRSHTLHCHFHPRDSGNTLTKAWRNHWSNVNAGLLASDALDMAFGGPAEFIDDTAQNSPQALVTKWTDFLFFPGRYSEATLEAALGVYKRSIASKSRRITAGATNDARPLLERVCECVGSGVVLRQNDDRTPAFDFYSRDVAAQWHVFYGVVKDLHKRRENVLTLALDPEHDMPWIVMAGFVSPVRHCAEIDKLCCNRSLYSRPAAIPHDSSLLHELASRENSELGGLLHAAKAFRKSMSGTFLQNFRFALEIDMLQNTHAVSWERLSDIYDQSSFDVRDEDYNALLAALDSALGGFANLSAIMMTDITGMLQEKQRGHHHKRSLSPFGFKSLVRGGQEVLQNGLEVLTDLLLLVVFIGADLEEQDVPRDLDPASTFDKLMATYRQYFLLHWLSSKNVLLSNDKNAAVGGDLFKSKVREPNTVTVLEWLFGGDWTGMLSPPANDTELLTYWIRAWTLGPSVIDAYDELTAHILTRLLQHGDLALAQQFSRYSSQDPWSRYVHARLMLRQGEFAGAAALLKQLQLDLDANFAVQESDRAGLLDLDERAHMNAGATRYYQHIVGLFDKEKAMSYVTNFAMLGLHALDLENKNGTFSGDATVTRTELLSRLFTAQIKTCRFEDAFETLTMHTDVALRRASLQAFLSASLARNQIKLLLSMSMSDDLAEEVDEHLASMATKALAEERFPYDANDSTRSAPKVLYAWRISRNDVRGAALCLWEQLQRLRQAQADGFRGMDVEGQIATSYLAIINCLSLVKPELAWMTVRSLPVVPKPKLGRAAPSAAEVKPKRKVVTLEDVRKEWQQELDRVADLEAGRFALPSNAMDMDMDDDNDGADVNGSLGEAMEVDVGA